jgi:DNA-directed RNA polymerase I and III subunit RPAC2
MAAENGDHEMTDAAAGAEVNGAGEDLVHEKQRLRLVRLFQRDRQAWDTNDLQLPGATDTAASFAFEKEDHTLGNALRYMIMKK